MLNPRYILLEPKKKERIDHWIGFILTESINISRTAFETEDNRYCGYTGWIIAIKNCSEEKIIMGIKRFR